MNEAPDELSWTIKEGGTLYVYGNAHVTEGYFDRRGRLVCWSYEIDPKGNILPAKRR